MFNELSRSLFGLEFWMSKLRVIRKSWSEFWFDPIHLRSVSLFRFILGCAMFLFYGIRFLNFDFYYTDAGIFPERFVMDNIPESYRTLVPFFVQGDNLFFLQAVLHLILTFLFAIGAFGRSLTWLLFVANLGIMQRNFSVVYGADLFCNFWLFYLSMIRHNQYFSIWNLKFVREFTSNFKFLSRRFSEESLFSDPVSTMGIRFLQIQLCLSYAYTGIEKLKGLSWWEGSAVWYVIGMEEFIPHDFAFLKHFPMFIALLSMVTLIFEIYFVFAVWNKKLRGPWLLLGFVFHLSTAIFMNLWFFWLVITSAYLVFLDLRARPLNPGSLQRS